MSELIKRDGLNTHYFYETKGKKYSVVDIGSLMKDFADIAELTALAGVFTGWEAMEIDDKNGLTGDPIRAMTWEQLETILDNRG